MTDNSTPHATRPSDGANQAGSFHVSMKPPLSFEKQLDLMAERGLVPMRVGDLPEPRQPVFKYASAVGWENLGKDVSGLVAKHDSVDAFKTKSIARMRTRVIRDVAKTTGSEIMSVEAVVSTYGERALGFLPVLNEDEIDETELGSYLGSTLRSRLHGAREQGGILRDTNFRKLVQIYDYLHYGKGKPPDLHQ